MNKIALFFGFAFLLLSCRTKKPMTSLMEMTDQSIAASSVNVNNIKSHIFYLASDELKGRDTPSEGLNIAARYLATSLMRYGVKPAYGEGVKGYYQDVPLVNVMPPSGGAFKFGDFESFA